MALEAYCEQLKTYRKKEGKDILLTDKEANMKADVGFYLGKKEAKLITIESGQKREVVLDLDTATLTVGNQKMPADYATEFLNRVTNFMSRASKSRHSQCLMADKD